MVPKGGLGGDDDDVSHDATLVVEKHEVVVVETMELHKLRCELEEICWHIINSAMGLVGRRHRPGW